MLSPLPSINIICAPQELPVLDPPSPFDKMTFAAQCDAKDRSAHLLPPPVHSPLSPRDKTQTTHDTPRRGLDPAKFEALLRSSRSPTGTAKLDLRKEAALRAHQSKQWERRNVFLSKIEALPSPTATSLPATPPESPAVFHFTLPSPGLVSPLALFEKLENSPSDRLIRVEHVDFRERARMEAEALAALTGNVKQSFAVHGLDAPQRRPAKQVRPTHQRLPSLEQISKRLAGNISVTRSPGTTSRLPAFLQRPARGESMGQTNAPPRPSTSRLPIGPSSSAFGPIARPQGQAAKLEKPKPALAVSECPTPSNPLSRPQTPLTAEALTALANRAERGSMMVERLRKRVSAPARLQPTKEVHPVLQTPGGF